MKDKKTKTKAKNNFIQGEGKKNNNHTSKCII